MTFLKKKKALRKNTKIEKSDERLSQEKKHSCDSFFFSCFYLWESVVKCELAMSSAQARRRYPTACRRDAFSLSGDRANARQPGKMQISKAEHCGLSLFHIQRKGSQ